MADFDAPQIPELDGAREVDKSRQPSETERRKHELTLLPRVPWSTTERTINDPHPAVIHDEGSDTFPKIECDDAEVQMKRDTTQMIGAHECNSSPTYRGSCHML